MTLPILTQTAREADPRRNYRLRDFLETLGLRPVFVPDPGPVAALEAGPAAEAEAPASPEAEAPEGESGGEDEAPAGEMAGEGTEPPAGEGTTCLIPPADSPLAPPAPYGHQSLTDALAAKDESAEAEAEAGQ